MADPHLIDGRRRRLQEVQANPGAVPSERTMAAPITAIGTGHEYCLVYK
jgi:hypothetical protein